MRTRTPEHPLRWLAALAALAAVWGAPATTVADSPPTDAKPLVLILLDTSGSMEYTTEGTEPEHLPTCHLSYQTGFDYEKSRWAIAVEVLTGSFNDYWCQLHDRPNTNLEEDSWYTEPHGIPRGVEQEGSEQNMNGLLDLHRDSVKFGLMTFDSNALTMTNSSGGFSYGEDKSGTNLGARNEGATFGAMVVPPSEETLEEIQANNDKVQDEVLATRPYSVTPTAPLLEDALYLFTHDNRVKNWDALSSEGDPYSDCRSRAVILVADGEPSTAYWSSFYSTPTEAALALYEAGIKVYVVALQTDTAALLILNAMAAAGGTEGAFVANDQAQLTAALGEILVELKGNRPARTRSIFTNRTLNFDDKQYQFFGSFSGAASPLDEQGHLDQYVYRCEEACKPAEWEPGDGASLCEIFSIDDTLNARIEPRQIYTQLDGIVEEVAPENILMTPDLLGVPTEGVLPRLDPLDLGNGQKVYTGLVLGDASDTTIRTEYFNQLLRLLRADALSRRADARLGAIVHSDPVVQMDLFSLNVPVQSYRAYRSLPGVIDRPTVLFVGTHEGMLHAFRVDRYQDELTADEYGEELWGFIPKHLLAKANSLAGGMQYLLDGDTVIRELRLQKGLDEITDTEWTLTEEAERWRSILMTGYGEGGRGYFALDVTKPREFGPPFVFLWELSNTELCYQLEGGTTGCDPTTDFSLLGTSKSTAAMGAAFFTWKGTAQERAVAIFGGGGAIEDEPESGKAIYVVDLATGARIREFCNDTTACGDSIIDTSTAASNTHGFDCPLTGDVIAFDDSPGSSITRAFIGDACGQLWRVDMTNPDPAQWFVELFFDAYEGTQLNNPWIARRRPLKLRPAMAIGYQRGELVLVGGTGNPDNPAGTTLPDRVFSIVERWDTTDNAYRADVNWLLDLHMGEVFTGEPLVFDQVAYFTTLAAASTGACAVGEGRLWGVHYTGDDAEATDDLEPMLDVNDDPEIIDLQLYMAIPGAELYGLQLVQRAACTDSTFNYAPWAGDANEASVPGDGTPPSSTSDGATFGNSSGAPLELVLQTADLGASDGEMQSPSGGGVSGTGTKKIKAIAPPDQSVFSASWGLLFD